MLRNLEEISPFMVSYTDNVYKNGVIFTAVLTYHTDRTSCVIIDLHLQKESYEDKDYNLISSWYNNDYTRNICHDFIEILKPPLQNFYKIMKNILSLLHLE